MVLVKEDTLVEEQINNLEVATNKDLDGDGDIGLRGHRNAPGYKPK